MQGPDYLYFFVDSEGRSLYVENGIVKTSNTPKPLRYTPGGWQDIAIDNGRNAKYWALDRSFSVPMDAVEDGALILKNAYYKNWIESVINLVILKQKLFYDGTNYRYYYDAFYKGEIALETFNHRGPKVTANISEGGAPKFIKARENVVYELEMDVPECEYIKMDGIDLIEKANFSVLPDTPDSPLPIAKSMYGVAWTLPLAFTGSDGNSNPGFLFNSQNLELIGNQFQYYANSTNFMAKADQNNQLNTTPNIIAQIRGTISYTCTKNNPNLGHRIKFIKSTQNGGNQNLYVISSGTLVVGAKVTVNINIDIPIEPDASLFMVGEYVGGATGALETIIVFHPDSNFSINYRYRHKTTFIRVLKPAYVYQKLVEKMSDGTVTVASDVLDAIDNFKLTSGDAIRGFDGAKFRSSFSGLFSSFNTQQGIGIGLVNGVLRLEKKGFFVNYADPIDIGEVSKLSVTPAGDYIFNTLKIGGPETQYDDTNGRQEFNGTFNWLSAITRVTKELNLVSEYRFDSYGIEFTRINLAGKTTTDSASDNDCFIIHTDKTPFDVNPDDNNKPVYALNRDLNPFAAGLLERNTVFNIFLSPGRCLRRNGDYIRSHFYRMDSTKLTFQTTEKNPELATTNPPIVDENGNITIGELNAPLFTPNLMEFETAGRGDIMELLEASPVRPIRFEYLGRTYMGIPLKLPIKGNGGSETYSVLSAPSNDLTQLIKVFE
jgi:hypothetical protein